jgi:L-asparaginase
LANKRVAVGSLGGTITMTPDSQGAGVTPTLDATDLLSAVPAIAEVADVTSETLLRVPGASLTLADLHAGLLWARRMIDCGHDGVVVVQGTDTIEESAYFFDLLWDRPEPIVVTGAMRHPATPGSDGPANLLAAVRVAADRQSRHLGALVVMNDEVHAAARVRKVRASGVAAFTSSEFGVLAHVEEDEVHYGNRPARAAVLATPSFDPVPRVALLETCLGDTGEVLSTLVDAGFDGVVVAGFGVGHVSATFADVIGSITPQSPVVLSSRTGAGTTFAHTYGFKGSEVDLLQRGVVASGWLDGRKARILLSCLLAAGRDISAVRAEFQIRGRQLGDVA